MSTNVLVAERTNVFFRFSTTTTLAQKGQLVHTTRHSHPQNIEGTVGGFKDQNPTKEIVQTIPIIRCVAEQEGTLVLWCFYLSLLPFPS